MSCLVAIDQSTSGTKALLFDLTGRVIDSESRSHEQRYPQPGWVEHDADQIWSNLRQVTRSLLERNANQTAAIEGVAITNQRETVVVFDRRTGCPLCPAIVWQCRRSDAICEALVKAGHESMIQRKTGLKLDAYFSASKITWLVRQRPEVADRLNSGEALVGTIDTYLIYRLTGGRVFATDHTNASRTLLFDLQRRVWDGRLCELFEVPLESLPEIRESFAEFGETDIEGALPQVVPIRGVMGDSQASLFAQRCYAPGDAKATFGSGTSVLMNIGHELAVPQEGMVSALAWVYQGQPTYAWEGLVNYSAATIAWLKDQLGLIDSVADSERLAAAVDDTGGVYLVPAFSGLGAPHWRTNARAAMIGMTAYTTKEHVVRAALESIAYQINDVLQMMQAGNVSPSTINADGGPTRNALLMQMVADITRLEVTAATTTEVSACGAAMAALLGLGVVNSLNELRKLPLATKVYRPAMTADEAKQRCAGWNDAVRRVL